MLFRCSECGEKIRAKDYCPHCDKPISDNALLREILKEVKKLND